MIIPYIEVMIICCLWPCASIWYFSCSCFWNV